MIDIRLLNTIIRKKESLSKEIKKVISIRYLDEIKQKAQLCKCSKKALFQYFQNKYGVEEFKCYNTFTYFTRKHDICISDHSEKPKLRYETEPGDQLQIDRNESIKMKLKDGTVIQFELFAATFSYSRYHFFLYSRSKTTEDFLRCLIDVKQFESDTEIHIQKEKLNRRIDL